MKIIFVNRFFFPDHSPTSVLLSDLAFHLADGGTDVRVITSRQDYDDPRAALVAQERIRGVRIYRIWTTAFGRQRL